MEYDRFDDGMEYGMLMTKLVDAVEVKIRAKREIKRRVAGRKGCQEARDHLYFNEDFASRMRMRVTFRLTLGWPDPVFGTDGLPVESTDLREGEEGQDRLVKS